MNDFTASNGYVVSVIHGNHVELRNEQAENTLAPEFVTGNDFLDMHDMQALREFFQAEADECLGRWRWPENPRFVVYPWHEADDTNPRIAIVDEGTGGQFTTTRATVAGTDTWAKVARSYFDAHPEPKPWHDAADGEVWALTGAGGLEQPWRRLNGGWVSFSGEIKCDAVHAIAGRRIWPEVSS